VTTGVTTFDSHWKKHGELERSAQFTNLQRLQLYNTPSRINLQKSSWTYRKTWHCPITLPAMVHYYTFRTVLQLYRSQSFD